jgi:hypothetical protein
LEINIKMKRTNILLALFIGVLLATTITACSKGNSPVEPVINDADDISQDVPISFGTESESRSVLAVYNATIDSDKKTFTIEPANRNCEYHFPLTQMYPNVLQITGYGWTPNFWADIKLAHPFPGSNIDGFDPRVIAILPANPGVSFNYPIFNVHANNSVVMEPGGYTKLFDWVNPSITGNANPFIAYFKEQPNRVWSSTGVTDETRRWEMDFPNFGGPIQFSLVVDVSTNYPNPPQPGIDNALEPVQVQIEIGDGLTPTGGEAIVTATFLDWQGPDEIKCKVESPALFENSVQLFYSGPGPNPDEYVFTGTISNDLLAPYGNYMMLLAVWDINAGNHLFVETVASVKIPFNPNNVTPAGLNVMPNCIVTQDQYLYVTCENSGFHIYDISDPVNPVWVNSIEFYSSPWAVVVSDEYAYVSGASHIIYVIDINPPESATIVHEVSINVGINALELHDEYLYALRNKEICIINIDPPESAFLVNTIDRPDSVWDYIKDISIDNGYALVTFTTEDLYILDVDPPESADWIGSVECDYSSAYKVIARDGYAYVISRGNMFFIVDLDPIESAHIIEEVHTHESLRDISLRDGYAYLACDYDGFKVVDIDPIASVHVVKEFDTPKDALEICTSDDYAYVLTDISSYEIIDIQTPESAHIVNTIHSTCNAEDLFISDDYVFLASGYNGLQIVDISTPESPSLANTIYTKDSAKDVYVSDGYAYIGTRYDGMQIIDIDPVESAHAVSPSVPYADSYGICVSGNYAYVTDQDRGNVDIFNVNPPESAHIVNTVDVVTTLGGTADKIFVSGDYAYVTNSRRKLHIVDISTPESAFLATTVVDIPGNPYNVYVSDGYAYVASYDHGLQIIDVDPVESARVVNSFESINASVDVFLADGYAYVKNKYYDLQIISVKPPDYVEFTQLIRSDCIMANRVQVSDGYAYLAGNERGLRIIDLW